MTTISKIYAQLEQADNDMHAAEEALDIARSKANHLREEWLWLDFLRGLSREDIDAASSMSCVEIRSRFGSDASERVLSLGIERCRELIAIVKGEE